MKLPIYLMHTHMRQGDDVIEAHLTLEERDESLRAFAAECGMRVFKNTTGDEALDYLRDQEHDITIDSTIVNTPNPWGVFYMPGESEDGDDEILSAAFATEASARTATESLAIADLHGAAMRYRWGSKRKGKQYIYANWRRDDLPYYLIREIEVNP